MVLLRWSCCVASVLHNSPQPSPQLTRPAVCWHTGGRRKRMRVQRRRRTDDTPAAPKWAPRTLVTAPAFKPKMDRGHLHDLASWSCLVIHAAPSPPSLSAAHRSCHIRSVPSRDPFVRRPLHPLHPLHPLVCPTSTSLLLGAAYGYPALVSCIGSSYVVPPAPPASLATLATLATLAALAAPCLLSPGSSASPTSSQLNQ